MSHNQVKTSSRTGSRTGSRAMKRRMWPLQPEQLWVRVCILLVSWPRPSKRPTGGTQAPPVPPSLLITQALPPSALNFYTCSSWAYSEGHRTFASAIPKSQSGSILPSCNSQLQCCHVWDDSQLSTKLGCLSLIGLPWLKTTSEDRRLDPWIPNWDWGSVHEWGAADKDTGLTCLYGLGQRLLEASQSDLSIKSPAQWNEEWCQGKSFQSGEILTPKDNEAKSVSGLACKKKKCQGCC